MRDMPASSRTRLHRFGGAERLGEEADPELLDAPPQGSHLGAVAAGPQVVVRRLHRLDPLHEGPVLRPGGGQAVEAVLDGPEVAAEVPEAGGAGGGHEAGADQPGHLHGDVGERRLQRLGGEVGGPLLDRTGDGQDPGRLHGHVGGHLDEARLHGGGQ
jgi:hypothetical protein